MSGLDGLIYMSSTSDSYGGVNITLTFASGTNPDIAQVQAQNKLQLITPLLPGIVQQYGLNVTKQNANFLMGIGFISEDGSMRPVDVADYLATTSSSASIDCPAWATCNCSAPSTPCASGS